MLVFGLSEVTRRFGAHAALRGVTLDVRAGERVAVVGPSGAGKSTLLQVLNTAALATSGTVRVLGADPATLSPRALRRLRARMGTVHQRLDLVPQASVFHNVVAGRLGQRGLLASLASLVSQREARAVAALLERLGIADKLHQRLDRLSGGEQQRVAVARVLHQAPDVLVADEPLASVDPARSAELVALLAQAAEGRTLVVSTHQLEPVRPHVTRVVGLREGRVAFDRPAGELTAAEVQALYALVPVDRGPPT